MSHPPPMAPHRLLTVRWQRQELLVQTQKTAKRSDISAGVSRAVLPLLSFTCRGWGHERRGGTAHVLHSIV